MTSIARNAMSMAMFSLNMATVEAPAAGVRGDSALRQYRIDAGEQMHFTPLRLRQYPFQLLRRRTAPFPARLHVNLLRAHQPTVFRTPRETASQAANVSGESKR